MVPREILYTYNMLRAHFDENIKPKLMEVSPPEQEENLTGNWYNLPLLVNKMILKRCDVASKLKVATISKVDRQFAHSAAPLCPVGAGYVEEEDIFFVCIRLFIERITFRIRWSESRQRFIVFTPKNSRVQSEEPAAPLISLNALPPKALRYLIKKTPFEALYDDKSHVYTIIGMGNSCDFRFPRSSRRY